MRCAESTAPEAQTYKLWLDIHLASVSTTHLLALLVGTGRDRRTDNDAYTVVLYCECSNSKSSDKGRHQEQKTLHIIGVPTREWGEEWVDGWGGVTRLQPDIVSTFYRVCRAVLCDKRDTARHDFFLCQNARVMTHHVEFWVTRVQQTSLLSLKSARSDSLNSVHFMLNFHTIIHLHFRFYGGKGSGDPHRPDPTPSPILKPKYRGTPILHTGYCGNSVSQDKLRASRIHNAADITRKRTRTIFHQVFTHTTRNDQQIS